MKVYLVSVNYRTAIMRDASQNEKTRQFFCVFLTLLAISGSLMVIAKAETVDEVDTYFESARGQLLAVYSSEVVSHAGIILGLIVALASVIKDSLEAIISNKAKWRAFLGVLGIALILGLIVYSIGRLLFWSGSSSALIGVTRPGLGVTITNSNITSCMVELNKYAINASMNSGTLTGCMALTLHPNNWILWVAAASLAVILAGVVVVFRDRFRTRTTDY